MMLQQFFLVLSYAYHLLSRREFLYVNAQEGSKFGVRLNSLFLSRECDGANKHCHIYLNTSFMALCGVHELVFLLALLEAKRVVLPNKGSVPLLWVLFLNLAPVLQGVPA